MPVVGFERHVITDELQRLAQRISDNIERNGQRASGKTQASIEVVDDGDAIALLGRKAFGTLERGVPPLGDKIRLRSFAGILYRWAHDKGIAFEDDRERWSFAFAVAKKIKKDGSLLFQEKGRADVYSNEIPSAIENIARRLGEEMKLQIESIPLNNDINNRQV